MFAWGLRSPMPFALSLFILVIRFLRCLLVCIIYIFTSSYSSFVLTMRCQAIIGRRTVQEKHSAKFQLTPTARDRWSILHRYLHVFLTLHQCTHTLISNTYVYIKSTYEHQEVDELFNLLVFLFIVYLFCLYFLYLTGG